ncbi:MAG: multicopper oxidase family protein [Chloroflexota bacterium]
MKRRDFLRYCAYGTTGLMMAGLSGRMTMGGSRGMHGGGMSSEMMGNDEPAPSSIIDAPLPMTSVFTPDIELAITAIEDTIALVGEQQTTVWRYVGEVLKGDPSILEPVAHSYLGPTLRLQKGQRVRVHFKNELPIESGIHWHGLLVPDRMDGHPRDVVPSGGTYTYEFELINRAGTYWYHPHPHQLTGYQVYRGLAGVLIISDDEEAALNLPTGAQDIPLVIQDRRIDEHFELAYTGNTSAGEAGGMMSGMMQGMMSNMMNGNGHTMSMGMSGNMILVNGQTDYTLPISQKAHRLRLLNGSNARIYVLRWSDGTPLNVIASDGGLLAEPLERPYVILGPAERVDLWVDFSQWPADQQPIMESYPLGNGAAFTVFNTTATADGTQSPMMPTQLSQLDTLSPEEAINQDSPRQINLTSNMSGWTLNGRRFDMTTVADDERVQLGTTEIWEFNNDNSSGMMAQGMTGMMNMPHPMHIHGVQFQVLQRIVPAGKEEAWTSLRQGYVDVGWKDTVLVMPGERVQVIMRFEAHPGLFLVHCHNLEHEDLGMMRNFMIEA